MDSVATLDINALNVHYMKFKKNKKYEKLDTPKTIVKRFRKKRKKKLLQKISHI